MRNILAIVFLFFFQTLLSCNQQKQKRTDVIIFPDHVTTGFPLTTNTDNLIQNLNTYTDLEGAYLGIGGQRSASYLYYEQLLKIADDSTFLRLTYHENPKMRVYGMWGLSLKNLKLAEDQLDRFYADSSVLSYHTGCITFPDLIYYIATKNMDSAVVAKHYP
jgi:hypothetical protein